MDSDYSYSSTSSSGDPGTFLAVFGVMIVIAIIFYVVFALFLGKIFKKAGEDAWKAWIPVYNSWVFLELGKQPGWIALLTLLSIIPFIGWIGGIVTYVFMCIAAYHIGKNLQKEDWFVVLYILFTPVWIIWLAVDDSKWKGGGEVPAVATAPAYQPPVATSAPQTPTTPQGVTDDKNPTPPVSS